MSWSSCWCGRSKRRGTRAPTSRRSGSASRRRSTTTTASPSPPSTCRSPTCRSATSSVERVGLPVFVDNDGNVAALAEYLYGAARGKPHTVMLTVGTGIGGGLILGGEIYRGSTGAGAELGHVVIQVDGPPCQGNCPNHGCVESLASGTALGREGRAAAESAPDSALGKALAEGKEVDGTRRHRGGAGRRRDRDRRLRPDRRPPRRRLRQLRQHLPAERDRRRRWRDRRRRPAAGAGPARSARTGAETR